MKWNWGWGIGSFLGLFICALITFVIFAWNQDVNLVYKDYYEKGVDYSAQFEKETRSVLFNNLISLEETNDSVVIRFPKIVVLNLDSGKVQFFRPSDRRMDCTWPMHFSDTILLYDKAKLISGRYIAKMTWFSGGIDFEVDKEIIINSGAVSEHRKTTPSRHFSLDTPP